MGGEVRACDGSGEATEMKGLKGGRGRTPLIPRILSLRYVTGGPIESRCSWRVVEGGQIWDLR